MKLSFIIEQARSGELASLSKTDKTDAKLVSYINLALIALYNRFTLAVEEAIITLRPELYKTMYVLNSTDPDVRVNGKPMSDDDFMSIVAAYEEDGKPVAVNDDENPMSIFTTSFNQIQVPMLAGGGHLSIIYRKNPTLVKYVDDGNGNALDYDVPLPMQLLEPLLHYVGYRAHGAVDGNVNAENSTHYTRFIAACNQAEILGVVSADDTQYAPIKKKGFV